MSLLEPPPGGQRIVCGTAAPCDCMPLRVNAKDTFAWKSRSAGDGTRYGRQAVPMQRKPLVVTALVSAVVGAVLAGLTPAALASQSVDAPLNRGWVSNSTNHGSDHYERADLTSAY
jgi:hypothetical protein